MIKDSMQGLHVAEVERWSPLVAVVRGLNPGPFTGPGTNTYLIGSADPVLLDTGSGVDAYLPLLEKALVEQCGGARLGDIALTHVHPDHIGGAAGIIDHFGPRRVMKMPWAGEDERFPVNITPIGDGDEIKTDGATLRAVYTPGHAQDHLCFYLEEERALFTGDVVLGAGTTVIPQKGGDLGLYIRTLQDIGDLDLERIYPGHGPMISDPNVRVQAYIDHRNERERQIVESMDQGSRTVEQMVEAIYVDTPRSLYPAAGQSVLSHLQKLERERRASRSVDASGEQHWTLS
jgi:glyoxylase-like metal-dependent hydrolase (beta-lactamase superfamily II)